MNRRSWLRWGVRTALAAPLAATGYGLFESGWFGILRQTITLPNLPASFSGTTIAFLTDLHHGRYTSLHYVQTVVNAANKLNPDLILLGGDYAYLSPKYLPPCFDVLSQLRAPLGVFGVLGNHDHWYDSKLTKECMRKAGIWELTNTGFWIRQRGERLRLGGVDDFWEGVQELPAALGEATSHDATIILSHNPDYAEQVDDPRVGLILSGHTHGGQIVLPGNYAPFVPSRYGQKYLHGLVTTPHTQVYVSRGLATTGPPLRIGARPEITLITLS